MKTGVAVATLAGLVVGGAAWAGAEDTNQPPPVLRLELDLADGSHIIGIPKIESVPVQTSYAKVDIPLKQIAAMKLADDHETASLDFVNGDKLKGVITLKPLELTTVFGPVRINIEHLREIIVSTGEGLSALLGRGLVLYYPFDRDEGGKVTDKSGKKNDGKVHGASWVPSGKASGAYGGSANGALSFNGSSDILNIPNLGLNGRTDATLATWIHYTGGKGDYGHVVFEMRDGASATVFIVGAPPNPARKLCMFVYDESEGFFGNQNFSADEIALNKWVHIAFVVNNGSLQFYINGVPNGSPYELGHTILDSASNNESIGSGTNQGGGSKISGKLDDFRIYNRALTADEVRQIYNRGVGTETE